VSPAARTHPRFVSDISRGYLGLGISLVLMFAGAFGFGVAAVNGAVDPDALYLIVLFLGWALLTIVASVLTVIVFLPLDAATLRAALVATTPTTRRARILWLLSGGGATAWAVSGSAIAVVTLVTMVVNRAFIDNPLVVWLGVAVVIGSMVVIFTSYAVRYARQDAVDGGVEFPGDDAPRFGDYLYLAIQVATTFGSSDVNITKRAFRRIVSVNSLVSFAFNSVIVALLVSVLINAAQE
jgi:uncharacterized membrane protein